MSYGILIIEINNHSQLMEPYPKPLLLFTEGLARWNTSTKQHRGIRSTLSGYTVWWKASWKLCFGSPGIKQGQFSGSPGPSLTCAQVFGAVAADTQQADRQQLLLLLSSRDARTWPSKRCAAVRVLASSQMRVCSGPCTRSRPGCLPAAERIVDWGRLTIYPLKHGVF